MPASLSRLCQLLAAFPNQLVGAHWVPGPGWTPVSCCGSLSSPAGRPASAGSASQNLQRPKSGVAPAFCSGPCLVPRPRAEGGGRFQAREGGRAREEAGSHQLTPSSARAQGSHVVVASRGRRGVRARGDGVTRFGGAGGGERCSLPPLRGPGLGPGGPRGQGKGPGQSPHPGLSQARAGAGSGPLPRASRSAKPGPGPRAPTAPPARGAPTSFSGQRRGGPAPEAAVAAAGLAPSEGPGGGSEPGPAPPPAAGGQSPPGLGGGRCKLPRIWVRPPASPTPGPGLH